MLVSRIVLAGAWTHQHRATWAQFLVLHLFISPGCSSRWCLVDQNGCCHVNSVQCYVVTCPKGRNLELILYLCQSFRLQASGFRQVFHNSILWIKSKICPTENLSMVPSKRVSKISCFKCITPNSVPDTLKIRRDKRFYRKLWHIETPMNRVHEALWSYFYHNRNTRLAPSSTNSVPSIRSQPGWSTQNINAKYTRGWSKKNIPG